MEKTTLINGNGQPYEREIPMVVLLGYWNDVALAHLEENTGIKFSRNAWDTAYEGHPETWEQFSSIFLSYNFLTFGQNNWNGNIMYLRGANVPKRALNDVYYEMDGTKFSL